LRYKNPIDRLRQATRYSLNGLRKAFKEEQAFEYEVVVLAVLIGVLVSAKAGFAMSAVLVGCWLVVMALELVNGAVERAFDMITAERDRRVGTGKDMLSGAVFLMVAFNVCLWVLCVLRMTGVSGMGGLR
jgi:diacylglycerol kinase (ATP)